MALLRPKWLSDSDEFKTSKNYKVWVHTVTVGDVEDPEIYIAEPILEWQQSEKGKWIMQHSSPAPSYHRMIDHLMWGYSYNIVAYLNEKDYTYYRLKYE